VGEHEVSDTEEGADVDEPAHEAVAREDIVGLLRSAGPNPRASFSATDEHAIGASAESGVTGTIHIRGVGPDLRRRGHATGRVFR
jgi:hypothetical protein